MWLRLVLLSLSLSLSLGAAPRVHAEGLAGPRASAAGKVYRKLLAHIGQVMEVHVVSDGKRSTFVGMLHDFGAHSFRIEGDARNKITIPYRGVVKIRAAYRR